MDTTLAPTLFARSFSKVDRRIRDVTLITAGSLFVAAMAQVRIPLPFTPVPITAQTFAVLLVAAALGSTKGTISLALYLLEGLVGLPFFAGGSHGVAVVLGPTGGYLLGFVAAAYLVGALAARGLDKRIPTALLAFFAGEIVIYLIGATWLGFFIGFQHAFSAGIAPFIIGDIFKLAAAGFVLPLAWKLVKD